jgi:membrane protein
MGFKSIENGFEWKATQKHMSKLKRFAISLSEKFVSDRTTTLSASLAFYSVLALAPLTVLILFSFSLLDEQLIDRFVEETNNLIGYSGGSAVELVVRSARAKPLSGGIASLVSLGIVLFSAGALFSELRESLGIVLRCERKKVAPEEDSFLHAAWRTVKSRLMATALALGSVVTLAVFLLLSTILSAVAEYFGFLHLELPFSFLLYSGIFSLLYMYGTYDGLKFRDALKGAMVTAVLFLLGKTAIGYYISSSSASGAYGAAGSIIALLLWIYCASLIVLVGAQAGWLLSPRGKEFQQTAPEEAEARKAG